MSVQPIDSKLELFFTSISQADWNTNRITSQGDVVDRSGCWGRLFARCGLNKGYDVAKAVDTVKQNILSFVKPEGIIADDELARRTTIVTTSVENINTLIARVAEKRPERLLEAIDLQAVLNPPAPVVIAKAVNDQQPASNESSSVSSATRAKRSADARTIAEGQAFIQGLEPRKRGIAS